MKFYILAKGKFISNENTKYEFFKEVLNSKCLSPIKAFTSKREAIESYIKEASKVRDAFSEVSLFGNTIYLGECVFLVEREVNDEVELSVIREKMIRERLGEISEVALAKEIAYCDKVISSKPVIYAVSNEAKEYYSQAVCTSVAS